MINLPDDDNDDDEYPDSIFEYLDRAEQLLRELHKPENEDEQPHIVAAILVCLYSIRYLIDGTVPEKPDA
jgi:uncharacterized protein (UPF0305 family)